MSFWLPPIATTLSIHKLPDHASDDYRTVYLTEGSIRFVPGLGAVKVPMTGYWSEGNRNLVWLGEEA